MDIRESTICPYAKDAVIEKFMYKINDIDCDSLLALSNHFSETINSERFVSIDGYVINMIAGMKDITELVFSFKQIMLFLNGGDFDNDEIIERLEICL